MLDIARIERIRLTPAPTGQVVVGNVMLKPNFEWFQKVEIEFENAERLPDEPVIIAMNHTDRYNYWPFQYALWKRHSRFTATWVKGKYYENSFIAKFMELTNNLPTVSRGYLIARDFLAVMDRTPSEEEYGALRSWVEGSAGALEGDLPLEVAGIPKALFEQPRNVLGYAYDPSRENYAAYINGIFSRMMTRFVELNREVFEVGLDLLVFPQGTRSVRLSKGHIGLAEVALAFRRSIVPVGCSGSDALYPGASPLARTGRVVYRFGEPIHYAEMKPFHVAEDFEPFTSAAEGAHREKFQGLVDVVMARINELVDSPYQFSSDGESRGVKGGDRFI